MTPKERILALKLLEKQQKFPERTRALGIQVTMKKRKKERNHG